MVKFTQKELEAIYDVFYNHIKPSTNDEAIIQAAIVDKIADELIQINRESAQSKEARAKAAAAQAAKEAYAKVMGETSKEYKKVSPKSKELSNEELGKSLAEGLAELFNALGV